MICPSGNSLVVLQDIFWSSWPSIGNCFVFGWNPRLRLHKDCSRAFNFPADENISQRKKSSQHFKWFFSPAPAWSPWGTACTRRSRCWSRSCSTAEVFRISNILSLFFKIILREIPRMSRRTRLGRRTGWRNPRRGTFGSWWRRGTTRPRRRTGSASQGCPCKARENETRSSKRK